MDPFYLIFPAFALVAFVYASVGFGGGSSYLALLSLSALPFPEIRFLALCCNVVVVIGNTVVFYRKKNIDWPRTLPLVIVSVPMAFLGARAPIHEQTFFVLLGGVLLAAAVLLWIPTKAGDEDTEPAADHLRDGAVGGALGLLSGLVGIGGGIFLSPVLHFTQWGGSRKITAATSIFILFNSLAGLAGQISSGGTVPHPGHALALCAAVIAGGQLGLRYSMRYFQTDQIRKTTAALVFFAGCELLWKHL